jgi:hypothetical protein
MSWKEKWKGMNKKQSLKDIERCRKHPIEWKILGGLFGIGYALLTIFMIGVGAFTIAIVSGIFAIWLGIEYLKVYRLAFPKTN